MPTTRRGGTRWGGAGSTIPAMRTSTRDFWMSMRPRSLAPLFMVTTFQLGDYRYSSYLLVAYRTRLF